MKNTAIAFICIAILISWFIPFNNSESKIDKQAIVTKRLTGAEKFSKYHSQIRKSPEGSTFNYKTAYLVTELENAKKSVNSSPRLDVTWESRGPGNVSGRCRGLWVDPSDTNGLTWFVGSAQGGVWKTADGGESYTLKTPNVPNLGTATVMGCNTSPNVIYAGSGEGFNDLSSVGAGIFKSTNGGENWYVLSSTIEKEEFGNIYRLVVDPNDPNTVYVATRNNSTSEPVKGFVMKTTNGGESWEEVLFHYDIIPQVIMSPHNSNVLFAGLNQEGLLRSVDGGENWDYVWLSEVNFPRLGRIEIAVSPSDPNIIYFTTQEEFEDKIYVSSDGGENFVLVNANTADDNFSNFSGGQSFWNKAIAIHPFDPLQIYVAGQSAILKLDVSLFGGGLAIGELSIISDGYGSYSHIDDVGTKGVHVDHHGITFSITDVQNEEFVFINTNDGGVAVSYDKAVTFKQTGDTFLKGFNPLGGTWETIGGLNASTFYGVDKMNGADRYVGGTQDNGSWVSPIDPADDSEWEYAPSGDGFEAAWNYNDPNQIIESSQGNSFHKSNDGGASWDRLLTPGRGPFITSIANSKQDPDMVMISTDLGPAVSYDFGDNWEVATTPAEYQFNGLRTPIDISLADPSIVWTGTNVSANSRICVSKNGGYDFEATSFYEFSSQPEVSGIATHPSDKATAYALFGAAGLPKILKTTDYGDTWIDISGYDQTGSRGFPDVAVYSLLVMPFDNDIIWVGTELGIIESTDGGNSWALLNNNLPATGVWEMKIVNDEIVVASHGRGIWTATLPELENYEPTAPSFLSTIFKGTTFDKKVSGTIHYRTTIDSGLITITVPTVDNEIVQTFPIDATEASEEPIAIDLEDLPIGDFISTIEIRIDAYYNGEKRVSKFKKSFYDVDANDVVEQYENDFDDGKLDFAVTFLGIAKNDFAILQPTNFTNNGFRVAEPDTAVTLNAILQKPILITESGNQISFDEIVVLDAGIETPSGDYFYFTSVSIEATNDKGETWKLLDNYSSEANEEWTDLNEGNEEYYIHRKINLSENFKVDDEVFIRLGLTTRAFGLPSWGWIIDNFTIDLPVATKDVKSPTKKLIVENNPFTNSTNIRIDINNVDKINYYALSNLKGERIDIDINANKTSLGVDYFIDGTELQAGVYIFSIVIDTEIISTKIVKL
ncbi:MAG: hypothetical protein V3V14_11870 [Saprospiraceae bacterium]